jgi:probable HAF family extracellular repeat protein
MSKRVVLLFALLAIVACGENTGPTADSTDTGPTLERDTASVFVNESLSLSAPVGVLTRLQRVDQPRHGVTRLVGSRISYTPARDFIGVDSFAVTGTVLTSVVQRSLMVVIGVRPGPFEITPIEEHGIEVIPFSMNERGQVVGYYRLADSSTRAFRWSSGVFEELLTSAGEWSRALHINNFGAVTGLAFERGGLWVGRSLLWRAAGLDAEVIDTSRSGGPLSINDRGEVLLDRAIWQNGGRRQLRFFDIVYDLNDRGDVLGDFRSSPYSNGVILREGEYYVMPRQGRASFIAAINDSGFGVGAGEHQYSTGNVWPLVIFRPGADSSVVTTPVTVAYGPPIGELFASLSHRTFNDRNWILATIRDVPSQPHNPGRPRLWIRGGVFEVQESLAEPEKWRVRSIAALNNVGQMTGLATETSTGKLRAVLLSPAEP